MSAEVSEWMRRTAEKFLKHMGFSSDPEYTEIELSAIAQIIAEEHARHCPSAPSGARSEEDSDLAYIEAYLEETVATEIEHPNLVQTMKPLLEDVQRFRARSRAGAPPREERICYHCRKPIADAGYGVGQNGPIHWSCYDELWPNRIKLVADTAVAKEPKK